MSRRKNVDVVMANAGLEYMKELFDNTKPSNYKKFNSQGENDPTHYDGQTVQLPADMTYLQGAQQLIDYHQFSESFTVVAQPFEGYFINDFLLTVTDILTQTVGKLIESPRDYEGDACQNQYIQIPLKYEGDKLVEKQAYLGSIKIQAWGDAIMTINMGFIGIFVKNKYKKHAETFLKYIGDSLRERKIMEGQALKIQVQKNGIMAIPIKLKEAKNIVLASRVESTMVNLIFPYIHKRNSKSQKAMFYGPYGTGKTETAIRAGVESIKAGRTFFYLENSSQLKPLIQYLPNYNFSTVFAEDLDQVASGERDSGMNDLLNTIDGQQMKNLDVFLIFTSNHVDSINPAFRRSGRIDFLLKFDYCDTPSIKKIFELNLENLDGFEDVDLDTWADRMPRPISGSEVTSFCNRLITVTKFLGTPLTTELVDVNIGQLVEHNAFIHSEQAKPEGVDVYLGKALHGALKLTMPGLVSEYGDSSI